MRAFEERLVSISCTLCQQKIMMEPPPLVFTGIYSAKSNFDKRQAIRDTWLKVLMQWGKAHGGMRYKFFLGELAFSPNIVDKEIQREIAVHDDIVVLNISEGYRMNSQKGVRF